MDRTWYMCPTACAWKNGTAARTLLDSFFRVSSIFVPPSDLCSLRRRLAAPSSISMSFTAIIASFISSRAPATRGSTSSANSRSSSGWYGGSTSPNSLGGADVLTLVPARPKNAGVRKSSSDIVGISSRWSSSWPSSDICSASTLARSGEAFVSVRGLPPSGSEVASDRKCARVAVGECADIAGSSPLACGDAGVGVIGSGDGAGDGWSRGGDGGSTSGSRPASRVSESLMTTSSTTASVGSGVSSGSSRRSGLGDDAPSLLGVVGLASILWARSDIDMMTVQRAPAALFGNGTFNDDADEVAVVVLAHAPTLCGHL